MADVAREAGVSITTVSHVLNRTASISPETSKRILEAVQKIQYQPSVRANAISKNETRTIGILAPDISNEFYSRCIQAACEACWEYDYTALVCGLRHDRQVETKYVRELIRNGVSGLVIFGSSMKEKHILDTAKRIPVVLGDCHLVYHPVSSVVTDNTSAMRHLIARLKNAGYTKIGYVSQDLSLANIQDRYMGFKMGLEENGLKLYGKDILLSEQLRVNKVAAAHAVFQDRLMQGRSISEVYVCTSDLIAIGVMAALTEFGYRIPKDVGVIGFDDISLAAYTKPPLTTVAQNIEQLGRSSFHALLKQIHDRTSPIEKIVIQTKLIVRETVRL